jgi:hypothetical protein
MNHSVGRKPTNHTELMTDSNDYGGNAPSNNRDIPSSNIVSTTTSLKRQGARPPLNFNGLPQNVQQSSAMILRSNNNRKNVGNRPHHASTFQL